MQPCRITTRSVPRASRACSRGNSSGGMVPCRNRSYFTSPAIFAQPWHYGPASSFQNALPTDLFRLIDHATAVIPTVTTAATGSGTASNARSANALRRRSSLFDHPFFDLNLNDSIGIGLDVTAPRFETRDVGSEYQIQGEVPGYEQNDLDIQFVDEQTLLIRGQATHHDETLTSENTNPQKNVNHGASRQSEIEAVNTVHTESQPADDANMTNYRAPSVEEDGYVDAAAPVNNTETIGNTNNSASADKAAADATSQSKDQVSASASSSGKESSPTTNDSTRTIIQSQSRTQPQSQWINSRSSTETFERRISFPVRIDQESVRANLKNGILKISIPKTTQQHARRIQID